MKFLKENWYKLMTGTAILIFACGFFIYAVGPSYANETSELNKPQMEDDDDYYSVVSGGYLYTWYSKEDMNYWCDGSPLESKNPSKRKLP